MGGTKQVQIPDFIASWQRFHGVFRGVPGGERFRFSSGRSARAPIGYNEWNLGGMLTFAKVHGKPFQINEWGVWGPDAAPFVEAMAAFLKTNGARSHTYWNSNGGYPGELTPRDKEWPKTTQAFKAVFGGAN